jgi:hypothetical protein
MKLTAISDPVRRSEVWQLQVGQTAAAAAAAAGVASYVLTKTFGRFRPFLKKLSEGIIVCKEETWASTTHFSRHASPQWL